MRSLTDADFQGWSALRLQQGDLTLHLVPAVGGRLMGMAHGTHELCFTHPALRGRLWPGEADCSAQDWTTLCGDWTFPLWGGGKTWLAPEQAWPEGAPHRVLDSGAWDVLERWCDAASMGASLRSPVCPLTGLQITRRLVWPADEDGEGGWTVEHTLHNTGSEPRSSGLWDVLMLNRPATVTLPGAGHSLRALSGQPPLPALQSAGLLSPADFEAGADLDAELCCHRPHQFKVGAYPHQGRVLVDFAALGLRYQRHAAVDLAAPYAHGHPVEVFNAPRLDYFEVETHAPLQTLAPGQRQSFLIHERVDRA